MKHRLAGFLLALTIVAGLLQPMMLSAQTPEIKTDSVKEDGLKVTKFETPYGNLVVNLPDDMSDSDTISGTVVVEPSGTTEEEVSSNSDTLSGYVIEVVPKSAPQKKTSCKPNAGDAHFCLSIPDICGAVDLIVTTKAVQGRSAHPVATCSVPCLRQPPPMHLPPSKAVLPTKGVCGKPIVVSGKCDGKFGNSAVTVAKKKCRMLAESPRKQVAESPKDVTGKLEIESVEGERRVAGLFENFPAPVCKVANTAKPVEPVQYMTMRSSAAPKSINLSGNWTIEGKNEYGSQIVPTSVSHVGNQATWGASGEGWSVSYRGTLSGNSLDTIETDNAGQFTAHGVLTYDENADTLSGRLTFSFRNGPQGVSTDVIMRRAGR